MAEKGPTFLNAYVIPALVLNLAVGGWTLVATHIVGGVMVYLGYVLIITVGLRLFLAYLDSVGWHRKRYKVRGKVNAPSENRIIIAKQNDGKMLAGKR